MQPKNIAARILQALQYNTILQQPDERYRSLFLLSVRSSLVLRFLVNILELVWLGLQVSIFQLDIGSHDGVLFLHGSAIINIIFVITHTKSEEDPMSEVVYTVYLYLPLYSNLRRGLSFWWFATKEVSDPKLLTWRNDRFLIGRPTI